MQVEHPIRVYRLRHNLTLAVFAERAKTDPSVLSRIERRTVRPTFELLRRLTAATGGEVTADQIIASMPERECV